MTGHQVASYGPKVQYEILIDGHIDDRWEAWFDGFVATPGADGTTTLRGHVHDQAALHGLVQKLRDLGIPLISLGPAEDASNEGDPPEPQGVRP